MTRITRLQFATCLLAFALRLFLLDAQSIWWDEAISIHLATSALPALLADRATHIHPPLYFILLKGWAALAGDSGFSVRFFSVWFNTLLTAAVYAFGRRWLDRRTGLLTSVLVALSPLYVIYSQEARVYGMLPLLYLAALALVNRLTLAERSATWRDWLLLAGVEAAGLHLHYVFLFCAVYINLLLFVRLRRRRDEWGRWLASLALVAILCLPWAAAVVLNRQAVLTDVGADAPFVEALPGGFFAQLLWTFQWSGLTTVLGYPPLRAATFWLAFPFTLALALLVLKRRTRAFTLRLLAHWLVPLSGALLMWRAKPLSHPRYVSIFVVTLLLLCGYALARLLAGRWAEKGLAALFGLAILSCSAISLRAYYFDPDFARDDTRGAAAAIAARSSADDLVLAPPEDWSVPYYYDGPAQVEMDWPGDAAADWERLAALTEGVETVFLVDYHRATRDPRALLPFALESAGSLSERWDFEGLYVRVYRLARPVAPPVLAPAAADFGPLRLTGAWLEPGPAADTALALALRWRLTRPTGDRFRVGVRLRDLDGWELSAADAWLLDQAALPTDRWAVDEETITYHVLPLIPGVPPLTYTLSIGVYTSDEGGGVHSLDLLDAAGNPQGQSYAVGAVALAPACGLPGDPYGVAPDLEPLPEPVALGDGLLLEAAALDRRAVAPGQSLFVTLRWRAAAALADLRPALVLDQAGAPLVVADGAPAGGRYPTDRWRAGEIVLEHRRLTVPPAAADGPAAVALELGEHRVVLGEVEIAAGEHTFTPPPMAHQLQVRFGDVAELLGYDLEKVDVVGGEPVTITLYWRALEGAANADYTVFAHLLAADGRLVGQHDGLPAGGSCPTPGWLPGEIVADRHAMTFREPYAGPARVEIGLYNSVTMERAATATGETFVILPSSLSVEKR